MEYSWPGNLRELENVIERAVIMSNGSALQLGGESLPLSRPPALTNSRSAASSEYSSPSSEDAKAEPTALAEVERNHIVVILERVGWRIEGPNGAAHALDLKPSTLRSRMKKFGIRRKGNAA
jgi:transcriptional regulator with GAF, ATPase, and Fis domain